MHLHCLWVPQNIGRKYNFVGFVCITIRMGMKLHYYAEYGTWLREAQCKQHENLQRLECNVTSTSASLRCSPWSVQRESSSSSVLASHVPPGLWHSFWKGASVDLGSVLCGSVTSSVVGSYRQYNYYTQYGVMVGKSRERVAGRGNRLVMTDELKEECKAFILRFESRASRIINCTAP